MSLTHEGILGFLMIFVFFCMIYYITKRSGLLPDGDQDYYNFLVRRTKDISPKLPNYLDEPEKEL